MQPDAAPPPCQPAEATPDAALPPETPRIPGYNLLGVLGKGGMGVVYHAYERGLGRPVAIKVLPRELSQRQGAVERFHREARAMAALRHPNIVVVYGMGRAGDRAYIAMEYVPGVSLARLLARNASLTPAHAVRVALQVADALAYAHALGVVHRDVKPSNVLLESGNQKAKVADFGLATVFGELHNQVTEAGAVIGTPFYMAPEQVEGDAADARTDVYALGVVMYQMLSGTLPYEGRTPLVVLARIASGEQKPFPRLEHPVPDRLIGIVEKAMRFDRADRYATMDELKTALYRLEPQPTQGRARAGSGGRTTWAFRLPAETLLLAVLTLAAVLCLALAVGGLREPDADKVQRALSHALEGDHVSAMRELERLRPRVRQASQEEIDFLVQQVRLERKMGSDGHRSHGSALLGLGVAGATNRDGAWVLDVELENGSPYPLSVEDRFFYMRGGQRLALPMGASTAGRPGRVEVPPGGTIRSSLAFERLPGGAFYERVDGSFERRYQLTFNDGFQYVPVDSGIRGPRELTDVRGPASSSSSAGDTGGTP